MKSNEKNAQIFVEANKHQDSIKSPLQRTKTNANSKKVLLIPSKSFFQRIQQHKKTNERHTVSNDFDD